MALPVSPPAPGWVELGAVPNRGLDPTGLRLPVHWILDLHVSKLIARISEHFPGSPVSCRASDVLRRDLISGRLLVGVEVRAPVGRTPPSASGPLAGLTFQLLWVARYLHMSKVSTTRHLLVALVSVLSTMSAHGARLVTEEATKVQVLKAAFPQTRVSVSRSQPLDWPGHELTDALLGEREYEVTGPPDKSRKLTRRAIL